MSEVRRDETGPASGDRDLPDCLGASLGVAAVNDDLASMLGRPQHDRATDARRRARHERPLIARFLA